MYNPNMSPPQLGQPINRKILSQPLFSLQTIKEFTSDLTYRKINDWDSKGLISAHRDTKNTGWRKFSCEDILVLLIISDLKNFGLSNERIKDFLKIIKIQNPNKDLIHHFELAIRGVRIFYHISPNDNTILFYDRKKTPHELLSIFDTLSSSPAIILPFNKYLNPIFDYLKAKNISTLNPVINQLMNFIEEERISAIIEFIKKGAFDELTIKKSETNQLIIKSKNYRRGNFDKKEILKIIDDKDFQTIHLSISNGQILTVTQDASVKV